MNRDEILKLYKWINEYIPDPKDPQKKIPNPAFKDAPWRADFTVDGTRYRICLDTRDKTKAKKLARDKELAASAGKLTANSASFARLAFPEACDRYLAGRRLELQSSSLTKENQLTVKLKEFFGNTRVNAVTSDMILAYREQRGTGPAIINMEIGVLRRIMKRAKCWHSVGDDIKPLKEPASIGRALTTEQKKTLLEVAALKPEWENAYLASVIALSTTLRGCEVRGLRWQDVNLASNPATLTINKGKTSASERTIPLTREAFEAFVKLRSRSELFGQVQPDHYVFARFRSVGRFQGREIVERRMLEFDPSQPVKSWRTAWRKLTRQAGLAALRFHDCRHTTITQLLTNPSVSIQTAKSIAGHVSQRMVDRYAHIHLDAKRTAVEALSLPPEIATAGETIAADLPM